MHGISRGCSQLRFAFNVTRIIRHVDTGYWAKVEVQSGGSWQAKAAMAAMAVLRVELRGMTWDVGFEVDPCACAPEMYVKIFESLKAASGSMHERVWFAFVG